MQDLIGLIDYVLNARTVSWGDEIHFLHDCPAFSTSRESLMGLARKVCKNFIVLSNFNKYLWLLNGEDQNRIKSRLLCSSELRQLILNRYKLKQIVR